MKLILFILIAPLVSFGQINPYPHGTLIVAVICNDGIIIAADSRASFTAYNDIVGKEIPYAYVDSNRKIFLLGNFLIGISGNSNVGNTYWWNLIDKYNKTHKPDNSIEVTFNNFKYFVTKKLKIADSLLRGNVFILTGYEKGKPTIMAVDSMYAVGVKTQRIKHRMVSNNCIKPKLVLEDNQYYCKTIETVLEDGFKTCSLDWQLGIGGPLHMLRINSDNSISEIKTFKFKRFMTYVDFEKSILNNKTKVTHFFPETVEKLTEILKDRIKRKI